MMRMSTFCSSKWVAKLWRLCRSRHRRHSHASRQVDSGANLKIVSEILGHRSSSSTSVYVRVTLKRLRAVGLTVPIMNTIFHGPLADELKTFLLF